MPSADEFTAGGMPTGGPCQVELSLTFEPGVATRLPELWAALSELYGADRITDDNGHGGAVGGPLVGFRWRMQP
jgi:hypothetical protein